MSDQGSIHNRSDLTQEEKDDLITAAVDKAIEGLQALADLTDVSLKSAADTAVWASSEWEEPTPLENEESEPPFKGTAPNESEAGIRMMVELWLSSKIGNPVYVARSLIKETEDVSILDVYPESE